VIDAIKMDAIKTKTFKKFLDAVGADLQEPRRHRPGQTSSVVKSARNIPGVKPRYIRQPHQRLRHSQRQKLVVDKAALAKIEEVFA
jgi:ribosomal protein L4